MFALIGCETTPNAVEKIPSVLQDPVLPQTFNFVNQSKVDLTSTNIQIPPKTVRMALVERPRAELREGPGIEYKLLDDVLLKSQKVIIFDRIGVWRKVIVSEPKIRGWAHHRSLSVAALNKDNEIVNLSMLPSAFASRSINLAYQYVDNAKIDVNIPRGAMFKLLRREKTRALVYILETNSMIWLPGKDVL